MPTERTVYVAWCKPDNDWDHVGEVLGVYNSHNEAKKHCLAWDKTHAVVLKMLVRDRYEKSEEDR